ncbi:MAG: succinate dehydrogenase cytochrome b subunit [Rikenellaceae bacterium]|jgi:succinate dehydrogenase / fumarate reductase cytochrome b subunit|nr:succinate dehydrogenase cytochrome b subunit [Rikenellaceae bacterium]
MSYLWTSSVGRKFFMGITGLFMILFLLFHMSMNLVAVFSAEGYDMICEFLGVNWYALIGTMVLALGFLLHILYASVLTLQNIRARGKQRYAMSRNKGVDFASRNMFVLGLIVLGGLGLHLANFWYKMQLSELLHLPGAETHGSVLIRELFSHIGYVIAYLVWFGALWFHLTHGFWSMFQSTGLNNSVWSGRLKCLSNIFATFVCLCFALVVVYYYAISLCA